MPDNFIRIAPDRKAKSGESCAFLRKKAQSRLVDENVYRDRGVLNNGFSAKVAEAMVAA